MLRSIISTSLFVRDLATCVAFYRDTLGLPVKDSNAESTGFTLGNQYFLLLDLSAAAHLISEEPLDLKVEGGPRMLLAAHVENVDAIYEELKAKGVRFLRTPADQLWGLRTAYFADPEGNVWEINQPVG